MLTAAVLFCAPAWPQTAETRFSAGVAASQQGDHQSALQHFLAARRQGMQNDALYYNLGVTYYRLGRLERAAAMFEKLTASPETAALAWYNLGLIAHAQGDEQGAVEGFIRAESAARTAKMRELARSARTSLRETDAPAIEPRLVTWIELGAGYDDNVLLLPRTFNTGTDREDAAARLTGFAQLLVAGDHDNGWLFEGVTHQERYRDAGDYDFATTLLNLEYRRTAGRWHYALAGAWRHASFGGDKLEDGRQLSVEATVDLAAVRLRAELEAEDIDAAPAFHYLDGERRAVALRLDGRGAHDWRLKYRHEQHDRTDLIVEGGDFFSFSPSRDSLAAVYRRAVTVNVSLEIGARHMQSRYRDPERRGGIAARREDTLDALSAAAFYRFTGGWRAGVELTGTRNASNFDEYDYRRSTLMFTLDRGFEFAW